MLGESLGKLDRVFLLISLVGALSFGIVMWRSDIILRYFLEKSDGQVIGHIVNVKKDARIRGSQSLMWHDAFVKEKLYEQDRLFAGFDSEILFELSNEQKLNLSANSMVILHTKNNSTLLNLQLGSVEVVVEAAKSVKFIHNDKIFEIRTVVGKGLIHINKKNEDVLNILSLESNIEVKADDKKVEVKKGEAINVQKTNIEHKALPEKIILSFPKNKSAILSQNAFEKHEGTLVDFYWQKVEGAAPYLLELSKSSDFTQLTYSKTVTSSFVTHNLQNGSYFWRVKSVPLKDLKSDIYELNVEISKPSIQEPVQLPQAKAQPEPLKPKPLKPKKSIKKVALIKAPEINLPLHKTTIVASDKKNIDPLFFNWEATPDAVMYEIQFSDDAKFKNILKIEKVLKNTFLLKKHFTNSLIYWRIRSIVEPLPSEWSEARSYEVQFSNRKQKN
ncbi:MAG: hypothetical protein A2Z20_08950 [Bdellovibrionales bacterium RBG_16_40_8]|nr:MAG: hypothetical protein A2Z20_08950 [Bdellovibrionales bacterium RBG_16_40_8]